MAGSVLVGSVRGSEGGRSDESDSFYSIGSSSSRREEALFPKDFTQISRSGSLTPGLQGSKKSYNSLEPSGAIELDELMLMHKTSSRYSVGE